MSMYIGQYVSLYASREALSLADTQHGRSERRRPKVRSIASLETLSLLFKRDIMAYAPRTKL